MALVRWDGLNKASILGATPWVEEYQGQTYLVVKYGTITVYLTCNESNNLVNGLIDRLEELKVAGKWPSSTPQAERP